MTARSDTFLVAVHCLVAAFLVHARVCTGTPIGLLNDLRPGYWLAATNGFGVWWCESGWKIGRERDLPDKPRDGQAKPLSVSAAHAEYEPVQVILRPEKDGEMLSATVSPLRNERGEAAAIEVRLDEVAYVNVTRPTDKSCLPGWYPDPLPPLRTPLALRAGQNQPLWLTFHVSRFTPAGDYLGELELKTTFGTVRVPLSVHVYDFAEYFWLLQQAIERVNTKRDESDLIKQARALLAVPAVISNDVTHFTTDPRPILDHRDRVARMIERLEWAKS